MELTATLPAFNERDLKDARRGYARVYVGAKTAWCSCCGAVWESDLWGRRKESETCPHCGAKGKVVKSAGKRTSDEKYYVTFVRVVGEWQVIRTAICRRVSEREDIWFCTNLELVRYLKAMDCFDGTNHSDLDLWFEIDGKIVKLCPNEGI